MRLIAVLVATCIAFWPALHGPQLFDDRKAIQDNPTITALWPISVPLSPAIGSAVTGRPIANLSLAFNYWINTALGVDQSADPGGAGKTISYHAINILLHMLCGLLLFGIVRRTLASGRSGERWAHNADAAALGVAALWLLHPLQADAVDYLVQRTELLVGLCYLATLYCSIRAWDAATVAARRWWFAAGVMICLLGMGAKEVMFSAPVMIVLYDRAFRLPSWRELRAPEYRDRRWFYAALMTTLLLLVALMATTPRGTSVGFNAGMPWYEYLHSQGWAIARYLRLVVWPLGFSLDYGADPVPHWRGIPGLLLLAALGVATLVAWTRVHRWGWFAFLGAWFFLILAPSSSFVPIVTEIAAERRMYLPLAAVLVAVIVAGDAVARRMRFSFSAVAVVALLLAALLAVPTFVRSRLYGDPEAIWRDATVKVPGNARAWYNHGAVLAEVPGPRGAEADADFHHAVQLDSSYADALLRVIAADIGRGASPQVHDELRHFPLESGNDTVLANLGKVLFASGDTSGAIIVLARAAEQPSTVQTLENLGVLYLTTGRTIDAASTFQRAIAMDPSRTDMMAYLGGLFLDQGKAEQAVPYLEEVARRQPDDTMIHAKLARAKAELAKRRP